MNKTTLKQKSKKELLNIATELGIEGAASLTSANLIDAILVAMDVSSDGKPGTPRSLRLDDENLEVRGASKKFEVQDKRLFAEPEYPVDETRDLPQGYGDTKIVAMVRDPYWLFVYWEINHEKRRELGLLGADTSHLVLRVWDITGVSFSDFSASGRFDVASTISQQRYVRCPPDGTWCVILGSF